MNMARAVGDAINLGCERMLEGEEMKTPSPMEESPQVLVKMPKIQTMAIPTPKGKERARGGEAATGSKDLFTRSLFDLGILEDILNAPPGQPDWLYSVLAGRPRMETGWMDSGRFNDGCHLWSQEPGDVGG